MRPTSFVPRTRRRAAAALVALGLAVGSDASGKPKLHPQSPISAQRVRSNVMVVVDTSGSMEWTPWGSWQNQVGSDCFKNDSRCVAPLPSGTFCAGGHTSYALGSAECTGAGITTTPCCLDSTSGVYYAQGARTSSRGGLLKRVLRDVLPGQIANLNLGLFSFMQGRWPSGSDSTSGTDYPMDTSTGMVIPDSSHGYFPYVLAPNKRVKWDKGPPAAWTTTDTCPAGHLQATTSALAANTKYYFTLCKGVSTTDPAITTVLGITAGHDASTVPAWFPEDTTPDPLTGAGAAEAWIGVYDSSTSTWLAVGGNGVTPADPGGASGVYTLPASMKFTNCTSDASSGAAGKAVTVAFTTPTTLTTAQQTVGNYKLCVMGKTNTADGTGVIDSFAQSLGAAVYSPWEVAPSICAAGGSPCLSGWAALAACIESTANQQVDESCVIDGVTYSLLNGFFTDRYGNQIASGSSQISDIQVNTPSNTISNVKMCSCTNLRNTDGTLVDGCTTSGSSSTVTTDGVSVPSSGDFLGSSQSIELTQGCSGHNVTSLTFPGGGGITPSSAVADPSAFNSVTYTVEGGGTRTDLQYKVRLRGTYVGTDYTDPVTGKRWIYYPFPLCNWSKEGCAYNADANSSARYTWDILHSGVYPIDPYRFPDMTASAGFQWEGIDYDETHATGSYQFTKAQNILRLMEPINSGGLVFRGNTPTGQTLRTSDGACDGTSPPAECQQKSVYHYFQGLKQGIAPMVQDTLSVDPDRPGGVFACRKNAVMLLTDGKPEPTGTSDTSEGATAIQVADGGLISLDGGASQTVPSNGSLVIPECEATSGACASGTSEAQTCGCRAVKAAADLYYDFDVLTYVVGMGANIASAPTALRNIAYAGGTCTSLTDPDCFALVDPTGGEDALKRAIVDTLAKAIGSEFSTSPLAVATQQSQTGIAVQNDVALIASVNYPQWYGHLKAFDIAAAGTDVTVSDSESWDAGKRLQVRPWCTRKVFTWNDSGSTVTVGTTVYANKTAIPLSIWAGTYNSTSAVVDCATTTDCPLVGGVRECANGAALRALATNFGIASFATDDATANRYIHFILGDPAYTQIPTSDPYHDWKLGPLMHVTPIHVGPAPDNGVTPAAFRTAQETRPGIVYAGSNTGFMHGFYLESGSSSGVSWIKGDEAFAFLPPTLLENVKNLYNGSIANQNAFGQPADEKSQFWGVAASAHATDVCIKDSASDCADAANWRTRIYFGLGLGGNAYYALDVTRPTANPGAPWCNSGVACPTTASTATTTGTNRVYQAWRTDVATDGSYCVGDAPPDPAPDPCNGEPLPGSNPSVNGDSNTSFKDVYESMIGQAWSIPAIVHDGASPPVTKILVGSGYKSEATSAPADQGKYVVSLNAKDGKVTSSKKDGPLTVPAGSGVEYATIPDLVVAKKNDDPAHPEVVTYQPVSSWIADPHGRLFKSGAADLSTLTLMYKADFPSVPEPWGSSEAAVPSYDRPFIYSPAVYIDNVPVTLGAADITYVALATSSADLQKWGCTVDLTAAGACASPDSTPVPESALVMLRIPNGTPALNEGGTPAGIKAWKGGTTGEGSAQDGRQTGLKPLERRMSNVCRIGAFTKADACTGGNIVHNGRSFSRKFSAAAKVISAPKILVNTPPNSSSATISAAYAIYEPPGTAADVCRLGSSWLEIYDFSPTGAPAEHSASVYVGGGFRSSGFSVGAGGASLVSGSAGGIRKAATQVSGGVGGGSTPTRIGWREL